MQSQRPVQSDKNTQSARKVFVIYGRNADAGVAIGRFLQTLQLTPLDFDHLASDLGGATFIANIVREGLTQAHGIIALLTPDELAILEPQHRKQSENASNKPRWQPRPNVIFEAGMAYAIAPDRTILVTLGSKVSLFSDVSGIDVLQLDNSAESRGKLRRKLIGIGCPVDQRTTDWTNVLKSGDFEACLSTPGRRRWGAFAWLWSGRFALVATGLAVGYIGGANLQKTSGNQNVKSVQLVAMGPADKPIVSTRRPTNELGSPGIPTWEAIRVNIEKEYTAATGIEKSGPILWRDRAETTTKSWDWQWEQSPSKQSTVFRQDADVTQGHPDGTRTVVKVTVLYRFRNGNWEYLRCDQHLQ